MFLSYHKGICAYNIMLYMDYIPLFLLSESGLVASLCCCANRSNHGAYKGASTVNECHSQIQRFLKACSFLS